MRTACQKRLAEEKHNLEINQKYNINYDSNVDSDDSNLDIDQIDDKQKKIELTDQKLFKSVITRERKYLKTNNSIINEQTTSDDINKQID